MGPSQVIMMDNSIRTHIRAINTTDTEIQAVFNTGQHVPSKKIEKSGNINRHEKILCIAAIPTYLIYNDFNEDLDCTIVCEHILDCQHTSDMRTHALDASSIQQLIAHATAIQKKITQERRKKGLKDRSSKCRRQKRRECKPCADWKINL